MSDARIPSKSITVERREVHRQNGLTEGGNGTYALQYYVVERQGMGWVTISKGYAHSTSAYAKLGRITNSQSKKRITQQEE